MGGLGSNEPVVNVPGYVLLKDSEAVLEYLYKNYTFYLS